MLIHFSAKAFNDLDTRLELKYNWKLLCNTYVKKCDHERAEGWTKKKS